MATPDADATTHLTAGAATATPTSLSPGGIVLYVESEANAAVKSDEHLAHKSATPVSSSCSNSAFREPIASTTITPPLPQQQQYTPPPPPPPPQHEHGRRNSRRDYVARRMEYWTSDDASAARMIELGSIHNLPLPLQVAFRRKMLAIFALQLLLVCGLVAMCAFYPPVNDVVKTAFQVQVGYLIGAAAALVLLLVLLYFIRALFPLNWLVLLVFSTAQAALFAALGVKFDTYLGVFNCGATLCCVIIMLLLAGVTHSTDDKPEPHLLSTLLAGFTAYVVVALIACALYVALGRKFVTPEGFGASLAFQFVLILWFAYDASSMYKVMSPDEYMHGVIYFYTDMVLLVIVCTVAAAVAAGFVAMAAVCEDGCDCDCGCGDCGCDGCDSCCGGCGGCNICGCNTSTAEVCGLECGMCECNPMSPFDSRWTWADICCWCDYFTSWCECCCNMWASCCSSSSSSSSTTKKTGRPSDDVREPLQAPYQTIGGGNGNPVQDDPLWKEPAWIDPGQHHAAVKDLEMQRV